MEYDDMKEIIKWIDGGAAAATKSESEIVKEDDDEQDLWSSLPENLLIEILKYAKVKTIVNCSATCKRWNFIANDEMLWKWRFQQDFKIDKRIQRKPGSTSWKDEYVRLCDNVPIVLTEVLTEHSNQVLHVSFSNNGKMFATTSKDGFIKVWNSQTHPVKLKYEYDMKKLCWRYTQFSQFNSTDTLVLVSGVHFGSTNSTSGEIAVFSVVNEFKLRCRVQNRPYDIFGCWYSDQHLLSGDLRWLAHLVSKSTIVLNKAHQETSSEHTPVVKELYNFYNRNASSVRNLMVANCPWLQEDEDETQPKPSTSQSHSSSSSLPVPSTSQHHQSGNPVSTVPRPMTSTVSKIATNSEENDYDRPIKYSDEFRREFDAFSESSAGDLDDFIDVDMTDEDLYEDLDEIYPKYLIFSTGSKTYTPHQIGIKRIGKVNFPKRVDPGPSIQERIAMRKRKRELETLIASLTPREAQLQFENFNREYDAEGQPQNLRPDPPDWMNFASVSDKFDKIDALIDLKGHIIGLALSPDHHFLYVNSRPWPDNCVITNPLEPPPISQEIDIHVIDLQTMEKVGTMLRAHKAYTPNNECFFIFLDVSDNFVGSGAEDGNAYTWERYYGVCLASYPHKDVVNAVAFQKNDDQMLITVSDDDEVKIWRSQAKVRELGCESLARAKEVMKKHKKTDNN